MCDCCEDDIRVSDIIRTERGIGVVWLQCPIPVAIKLIENEKMRIGWATVRCELASVRPLRCYRCLETGHSRYNCTSSVDRSGTCFCCGEIGHRASECRNRPSCIIILVLRRITLFDMPGKLQLHLFVLWNHMQFLKVIITLALRKVLQPYTGVLA